MQIDEIIDATLAGRVIELVEHATAAALAIKGASDDERACLAPELLELADKITAVFVDDV